MKTRMQQNTNDDRQNTPEPPQNVEGNSFHIAGASGSSPLSPTIHYQALSQPEASEYTGASGSNVPKPFWDRVHIGTPDECWLWKGSVDKDGYGRAHLAGKVMSASRAAYIVATGSDAAGFLVCHRCNNPRCCNPSHLYAGTKSDNERDKFKAGKTHKGEKNPTAKLTAEKVENVRRLFAIGKNNSEIGRMLGVHHSTISKIRTGNSW